MLFIVSGVEVVEHIIAPQHSDREYGIFVDPYEEEIHGPVCVQIYALFFFSVNPTSGLAVRIMAQVEALISFPCTMCVQPLFYTVSM